MSEVDLGDCLRLLECILDVNSTKMDNKYRSTLLFCILVHYIPSWKPAMNPVKKISRSVRGMVDTHDPLFV